MRRTGLLLCAITACGTTDYPDPGTVIVLTAGRGVALSEPSGIYCGTCATYPPSDCPASPPPQVCAYDFGIGTTVRLGLGQQQLYFQSICSSPDDPTITSCTFVVTKSVHVRVEGVIAVD